MRHMMYLLAAISTQLQAAASAETPPCPSLACGVPHPLFPELACAGLIGHPGDHALFGHGPPGAGVIWSDKEDRTAMPLGARVAELRREVDSGIRSRESAVALIGTLDYHARRQCDVDKARERNERWRREAQAHKERAEEEDRQRRAREVANRVANQRAAMAPRWGDEKAPTPTPSPEPPDWSAA